MALPAKSIAIGQPRQLEGIRQKHMIICENEPAELPDDVVRSDTKIDDGIEQWNLNLGNLKERFERGQQDSAVSSQPTSAGIVFEKPSFNVKQTLLAFETKLNNSFDGESNQSNGQHHLLGDGPKSLNGRPVVRKLVNFNGFLNNNSSQEEDSASIQAQNDNKPLPMRRSESLMMRLKKYESRIAGEQVDDDDDDNSDADNSSNDSGTESNTNNNNEQQVPKEKLTPSINLSSLKSKWENGDINKKRKSDGEEEFINGKSKGNLLNKEKPIRNGGSVTASTIAAFRRRSSLVNGGEINKNDADDVEDNNTESIVMSEKDEELIRIRQSLASRKKSGGESIKNIYENAIKEAQMQQQQQSKRNSTDLSAEISTSINQIQKQLLQPKPIVTASATATTLLLDRFNNSVAENNSANNNDNCNQPTPIKDHFQLLTTNKSKANKLKEKFELGLINNNANSDEEDEEGPSNGSKNGSTAINGDSNDKPSLSNLDIIRQEKMDDLSVFIDGEIKAREARHLFQQIDRKISAASKSNQNNNHLTNGITQTKSANVPSRSLAFIGASMRAKLTNHMQENETTPLPETLNASTIDCEDRKKCEGQVKNGSEKEMVKLTTEMQISNTSSSVAKSTKQMQANGTPLPQIAATRPIETTQANNGDTKPQSDFKDAPVAIERKNLVVEKQQSQHQTNGHQPVEEQLEQNQKPLLQQTQSQPQQLQQPPQQQHPQQQKPQKQPKVQKQQKPLNKQQQQPQQPIRLANNVRK